MADTCVWAAVVRVSFVGERRGDRFHADDEQLEDCERAIAAIPGAALHVLPPELNVSGGLPLERRPSLLAAVEGVERGDYAGIVVSYLSRLGRNVREQLKAWDRVEAAGGRIIVVREAIDTSTPTGRLQRVMLLGMAEHERELHVERFDERRRRATEAGIWQRRQTPRGYRRDPKTRRLVPNGDAPQVVRAFELAARGTPTSVIAAELVMTTGGVRHLLQNRVYLGELKVGQYVNADAHPAIVEPELFEAARLPRPLPQRSSSHDGPALLAGIVRCAGCGHVMGRSRTKAVVYVCHGRSSAGKCPAPAAVTVALLDELVDAIVRAELARVRVAAGDDRNGGIEAARERHERAKLELVAYVEGTSAADVGPTVFGEGARKRRAEVDRTAGELQRELALRPVAPIFETGLDAWDDLGAHERNALLRALLQVVVVRRGGGRGSHTPLLERVQVIAAGEPVALPVRRGHLPLGIHPLGFLDPGDPRVLRVPSAEDALERAGSSD